MDQSYLLIGAILFITYLFYKLFISFFIEYLQAGFKLGFDKFDMIYRPLSTYAGIYKQSLKKYKNSLGHIHEITRKRPEVKIVFIRVLGTSGMIILDPEYIKKLSFEFVANLNKRQFLIFVKQIEKGLIFAEGEIWKNSRKLLSNLFHFNILEARTNIMENVIEKKIKSLHEEKPNLFYLGCAIGGQIVLKSLFGQDFYTIDFDGRNPYEEINELFRELILTSRGYANLIRMIFGQRATRDSKFLTEKEKKSLKRLIQFKEKCKDFLRIEQESYKTGKVITQFLKAHFDLQTPDLDEVVEQLFLFLFAGEDTTGALISYCLHYLAEYPQYQKLILQDVEKSGVHASKVLNNFISEVNRICAPVQQSLSRKVIKPFQIDGYTFKTGTVISLAYRAPMNNPKYWDEPEKFVPERFERSLDNPLAYTPFSTGPRNCIGQHMALMQIRLAMVRMLERYTFEQDGKPQMVVINKGVVTLHENLETVKFNLKEKLEVLAN